MLHLNIGKQPFKELSVINTLKNDHHRLAPLKSFVTFTSLLQLSKLLWQPDRQIERISN